MSGCSGSVNPAFGSRVLIRLEVVYSWRRKKRIEGLELAQNDIEVWVDENVGRPNCSMGMAANMQPGQCRYETMRPGDESLPALLLG